MKKYILILATLVFALVANAQLQVGQPVSLTPFEGENYRLYASSTGTTNAPGSNVSGGYGVARDAVIVGALTDGRYQVEVDAEAALIGGIAGWVESRFVIAGNTDGLKAVLSWQDNSDNEQGFVIERALHTDDQENFLTIGTVDANVTTFTDTGVITDAEHFYRVAAFNSAGTSPYSNIVSFTPTVPETLPVGPTGLDLAFKGRLINISSRALVSVGPNILIDGFVIHDGPLQVLIRAVGPRLGEPPFNLPEVLSDPTLTLFRGQVEVASNDNWGGNPDIAAAATKVFAFGLSEDSLDSALLLTLEPGQYTVHVNGVGGVTGVALLEVYEVLE